MNLINWLALLTLTIQNASHSIVMRYSRGVLKERFITNGAVIMMEVIKGVICLAYIYLHSKNLQDAVRSYTYLLLNSLPLSIPAGVYFIQNNLAFTALQNLDPAIFSVLSQLKLLTAAVFSVIMLNKQLSWRKWRNLLLLIVGVVLIILSAEDNSGSRSGVGDQNLAVGVTAVVGLCTCSGLAGVYFEKVLKSSQVVTLWDRNLQLSFYSIIFGIFQLIIFDRNALLTHGFFYDYSIVTWLNIFIGAVGGIIVAVVVKYTDTIMKGFATSAAIILTTIFGFYYFETKLTHEFVLGVFVVIISLFNYSEESPSAVSEPRHVPLEVVETQDTAVSKAN